ncbi:MAG: tetratricopeptide repeat protein [Acidobacteriota bacterium]|nr:tetratricopeptide repeat protein [Acidobacteriota bacterium]
MGAADGDHFDDDSMADLIWKLLQEADPEAAAAVRDLCGLCERCDSLLGRFFFRSPVNRPEPNRKALQHRVQRLVRNWLTDNQQEREVAMRLTRELVSHPPARRQLLVRNSETYRTWAVCGELCEISRRLAPQSPRDSVEAAELAVQVAELIDPVAYGPDILEDIRATAQAFRGNSLRVLGDLRSADGAFIAARRHLAAGSGAGVARIQVAELESSLRAAQGRTEAALALLDEVLTLCRRYGDSHRQGRNLIKRAEICRMAGRVVEAVEMLEASRDVIDSSLEPRLEFIIEHTLCFCLIELGRFDEAARLLPDARRLAASVGKYLDGVKVEWLGAKIDAARGRAAAAAMSLREVRDAFLAAGVGFDAALASLELSVLYLERGMTEQVKKLAREMLPLFDSSDLHREAMAALIVFQKAALMDQASVGIALEVQEFLSRARRDRCLSFRGESS